MLTTCLRESTNSTCPEESAKASRSLEELRSELDARREAQADALARQRERLVEEHQQECRCGLGSCLGRLDELI